MKINLNKSQNHCFIDLTLKNIRELFLYIYVLINQVDVYKHKLMIALRGYYSRLFSYLQSSNRFYNSQSTPNITDISENGQKAVLATAIIREILYSEPPKSFSDLSLRDKILQLNPKINNAQISPKIKNEVFQLLTTGILLNDKIFNQNRLRLGKQQIQFCQNYRKFIFYPNYLTTRQIFQLLLQQVITIDQKKQNILVTGGFGIAKTISFIFYIHVSHHIHKYYHQVQENIDKKSEFQNLLKLNHIKVVPKCFYWSIERQNEQTVIQQLIYEQLTQLSDEKRRNLYSKLKNFEEFKKYFLQVYPRRIIHTKLVVDQINYMASIARQWRIIYQQIVNLQSAGLPCQDKKKSLQNYSHKKDFFQKTLKVLDSFKNFGDCAVFNSSTNIQQNLLNQTKGQYLGIGIVAHSVPKKVKIGFQDLLKNQKWAKINFWQYFWFQIQRKLHGQNISINLDQLRKIFFEYLASSYKDTKSYFRFYYVATFLQGENFLFHFIDEQSTKEQIINTIIQMRERFNVYCLQKMKSRFNVFLTKGDIYQKKAFLLQLYKLAAKQCDKKQINFQISEIIFKEMAKKTQLYNNQLFDYQILGFETIQRNNYTTVRFALSSFEIFQILAHILQPQRVEQILFDETVLKAIQQNPTVRGHYLQRYLIACLTDGTKVKFPEYINNYPQKTFIKYSQFNILDTCQFQSLSPNTEYRLQKNFGKLLQVCKKNQRCDIVGLPFKNGNRDCFSPSIDFIIASYNSFYESYVFQTFDVTVSNTAQALHQKQKKVIKIFKKLLKNQQNLKISIKHAILYSTLKDQQICFQKQVKLSQNQRFSVCYGDWSQIKFTKWNDQQRNTINRFQKVVKTIKDNDNNVRKVDQKQIFQKNNQQSEKALKDKGQKKGIQQKGQEKRSQTFRKKQ